MSNASDRTYRRARRDLSAALAALVDRGQRLAGARVHRKDAGLLIRDARLVRVAAGEAVTYAVLSARAAGMSWGEVAEHLSSDESFVIEHYGPIEAQWREHRGIGPRLHVIEGQPVRHSG